MIYGIRHSQRIGPPTIGERIDDPLRFAAIVTALLVVVSAFVTWVQTWGERLSSGGYVEKGCIIFALLLAVIVFPGLIGPGRARSIALGVVGAFLVSVVWFLGLPLLAESGAVIVPVRP